MSKQWHVIGASVQGTSHRQDDIPCQDAHAYRVLSSGSVVTAVADGAGSAEHSDKASQRVVERAVNVLAGADWCRDEADWARLIANVFSEARNALVELATIRDLELKSLATTLICAVVTGERLVVGQLGDGIVVARDPDGALFAASTPQHGEYANETRFLTQSDALQNVQVAIHERPVCAAALTTDGLFRLAVKLPENLPHAPFFLPLFDFALQAADPKAAEAQLGLFLDSKRVCARADDDKTLVLAVR